MFVGREKELSLIQSLLQKPSASVLVYGKRKVGKTTLLIHALQNSSDITVYYECIRDTLQENVACFVRVLAKKGVLQCPLHFDSFLDLFTYLDSLNLSLNIVIDEYPYLKSMADKEKVDSVFQNIIDNRLHRIRLFLSGSHIGIMKDLLSEKNALYGRFSAIIRLQELNYQECSAFYENKSVYDKIAFFSVFGGSPYGNTFIQNTLSLKENIIDTFLNPFSALSHYVEHLLLSDYTHTTNMERILYVVANGKKRYGEIESTLNQKSNGLLSSQLKNLLDMDILSKVYPINKPDDKKKVFYEISDNLLRFYYAFIHKNKSFLPILGAERFYEIYIRPSLTTYLSHRFEEMARSYFSLLVQAGQRPDILSIGTYYYDGKDGNGEFDVALHTETGYEIGEVKYYSHPLTRKEMEKEWEEVQKIKGISVQKLFFLATNGAEESPFSFIPADDMYHRTR